MAKASEQALFAHLFDPISLDVIMREGLPTECIKTDELRRVFTWTLDYYDRSGRTKAPTIAAMVEEWGQMLEDAEMDWDGSEPESIEWVIDTLKAQHAYWVGQSFTREWSTELAEADNQDKVKILNSGADRLFSEAMALQNRSVNREYREGIDDRWAAYEAFEASGREMRGMLLGLPPVDEHTFGIHESELALLAAGPKTGKSFFLLNVAREEWQRGRDTVLFTLENTTDMALDRLICLAVGINANDWQRGTVSDVEKDRFSDFRARIEESSTVLRIIQPEPGQRTMASMVRTARNFGAQSLLIDQLTFAEHPDPRNKPRHEVIRDLLHDLKTCIGGSREPMSCLLAHQINRDGIKAAEKEGNVEMYHMAEGSEVERTADLVVSLYQSKNDRAMSLAKLSILAARRMDIAQWMLAWRPWVGDIRVRRQITEAEIEGAATT